MTIHLYTPAQVTLAPRIENHIRVIGGKTWDFSRFALATPVILARGGKSAPSLGACRCFEVRFDPGSAALSEAMKWRLIELPHTHPILVASGTSMLARERAQAVSAFLEAHRYTAVPRRLYREGSANDVLVLTDSP